MVDTVIVENEAPPVAVVSWPAIAARSGGDPRLFVDDAGSWQRHWLCHLLSLVAQLGGHPSRRDVCRNIPCRGHHFGRDGWLHHRPSAWRGWASIPTRRSSAIMPTASSRAVATVGPRRSSVQPARTSWVAPREEATRGAAQMQASAGSYPELTDRLFQYDRVKAPPAGAATAFGRPFDADRATADRLLATAALRPLTTDEHADLRGIHRFAHRDGASGRRQPCHQARGRRASRRGYRAARRDASRVLDRRRDAARRFGREPGGLGGRHAEGQKLPSLNSTARRTIMGRGNSTLAAGRSDPDHYPAGLALALTALASRDAGMLRPR